MKRFVPYAHSPGRLLAQLFSDTAVAAWTTLWVLVGMAVHAAVSVIAEVGHQVQTGATGIADNLGSAGNSADDVPLIGDAIATPLTAASQAALDLASAGQSLDDTASWLAWVLALAVAATPILAVAMPWLALRIRFFRRKRMVLAMADTPAGQELLALRALTNRPLRALNKVSVDPAGAWRRADVITISSLAALEIRAAGLGSRRPPEAA